MATSIERRISALEQISEKDSKGITVRMVAGEGTPQQRAEHEAMRAAGVNLMVVHLVPMQPRQKPTLEGVG